MQPSSNPFAVCNSNLPVGPEETNAAHIPLHAARQGSTTGAAAAHALPTREGCGNPFRLEGWEGGGEAANREMSRGATTRLDATEALALALDTAGCPPQYASPQRLDEHAHNGGGEARTSRWMVGSSSSSHTPPPASNPFLLACKATNPFD